MATCMPCLIGMHDRLIDEVSRVDELTLPASAVLLIEQGYTVVHMDSIILIIGGRHAGRSLFIQYHSFHTLSFLNIHSVNLSFSIGLRVSLCRC